MQKVPPPERVRAAHLRAKAGARVDRDGLVAYLERNGYHRDQCRGGGGRLRRARRPVDVFPSGQEQPVRLDFFGSTLESIRSFDPLTQRSQGKVAALELMPVSEVLLDGDAVEAFKAGYLRRFGAVTADPLLESIEAGRVFPGMEHWLPLFHPDLVPLTAYLDPEAEIGLDHLARDAIKARAALIGEHYEARLRAGTAGHQLRCRTLPAHCRPSCSISTRAGSSASSRAGPASSSRLSARRRGRRPASPGSRICGGRPSRDFAPERAEPAAQPVRRDRGLSRRAGRPPASGR